MLFGGGYVAQNSLFAVALGATEQAYTFKMLCISYLSAELSFSKDHGADADHGGPVLDCDMIVI